MYPKIFSSNTNKNETYVSYVEIQIRINKFLTTNILSMILDIFSKEEVRSKIWLYFSSFSFV